MNIVKDIFEIVYYVAFIVLTWMIVIYARRTFVFQTKKTHNLMCKFRIMEGNASRESGFGIELFNYGNDIAKDISVEIDNGIKLQIEFIRPNESIVFPVGQIYHTMSENIVFLNDIDNYKQLSKDDKIMVTISTGEGKSVYYPSTDMLFCYRGVSNSDSEIIKQLSEIERAIKQLSRK